MSDTIFFDELNPRIQNELNKVSKELKELKTLSTIINLMKENKEIFHKHDYEISLSFRDRKIV